MVLICNKLDILQVDGTSLKTTKLKASNQWRWGPALIGWFRSNLRTVPNLRRGSLIRKTHAGLINIAQVGFTW